MSTNLLTSYSGGEIAIIAVGILILVIFVIAIIVSAFKKKVELPPEETKEQTKISNPENITPEIKPEPENPSGTQQTEPKITTTKTTSPWIKALVILIALAIGIFCIVKIAECATNDENKDGNGSLISRSARTSDIDIEQSDEFSISFIFILVSEVDIEDLEVTFKFMDENKDSILNIVKQVGNVSADIQYTISISTSEISLSDRFKIEQYTYSVTGGTVSYIQ